MPAIPIHIRFLPGTVSRFVTVPDGSKQPQQLREKHESCLLFEKVDWKSISRFGRPSRVHL